MDKVKVAVPTPTLGRHRLYWAVALVLVVIGGLAGVMLLQGSSSTLTGSFTDTFGSTASTSNYAVSGGVWGVADGVLRLSSPVKGGATQSGNANLALYQGSDAASSEWELQADVAPATAGDASLIFNYQDSNNYYYANFSTAGGSIRKVAAGIETKLASFHKPINANTSQQIMIRRRGSDYRAYINAEYLTKVTDQSFTNGLVGVGSRASAVAFDGLSLEIHGSQPVPGPALAPSPLPAPAPAPVPVTGGREVPVKNSAQLATALAQARPGDTIRMADGVYSSRVTIGKNATSFAATVAGTSAKPITLIGSRKAVIDGGDYSNYGLYLVRANYWRVTGITVRNAAKGIVLDASNWAVLEAVRVHTIGEEGVHFRAFSSDNTIKNSIVEYTGTQRPQDGQGIYTGSAASSWATYTAGNPDASDRNSIVGNVVRNTSAESLVISEGTSSGVVKANTFDGVGMGGNNYADSLIDAKGNAYAIRHNIGRTSGASTLLDAFQVHQVVPGWGNNNSFTDNTITTSVKGYGISVQAKGSGNVVYCNNTANGPALGLTNLTCTQQ